MTSNVPSLIFLNSWSGSGAEEVRVADKQVEVTVIIDVAPGGGHAASAVGYNQAFCKLFEAATACTPKEIVCICALVCDKQVGDTVIVEIAPDCASTGFMLSFTSG